MSAGDLLTTPTQVELWRSDADRLLLGSGTNFKLERLTGLDLPPIRDADAEREEDHGSSFGLDYLGSRRVRIMARLYHADAPTVEAERASLARLLRESSDLTLGVYLPQQTRRYVFGRPRGMAQEIDRLRTKFNLIEVPFEIVAADPRIYGGPLTTQITLAGVATTGNAFVVNGGDVSMRPVLEITGPATNPAIRNTEDGNRQLTIAGTVPAAQTLVIDVAQRTVTLNGVANYGLLSSTPDQWWELLRGTNTITYTRSGGASSSTLTVRHRDAWSAT